MANIFKKVAIFFAKYLAFFVMYGSTSMLYIFSFSRSQAKQVFFTANAVAYLTLITHLVLVATNIYPMSDLTLWLMGTPATMAKTLLLTVFVFTPVSFLVCLVGYYLRQVNIKLVARFSEIIKRFNSPLYEESIIDLQRLM